MSQEFFTGVPGPIPFGGLESTDPLSFKVYRPDRLVLGKRMVDHLRPGVCFWHSFAWAGTDMFGLGTFDRPWITEPMDQMDAARMKMAAAFEFFTKLGIPWYCFHDRDVAPEGASFAVTPSRICSAMRCSSKRWRKLRIVVSSGIRSSIMSIPRRWMRSITSKGKGGRPPLAVGSSYTGLYQGQNHFPRNRDLHLI